MKGAIPCAKSSFLTAFCAIMIMNLSSKKFIPYYIAAAVIIILAVFAVIIISAFGSAKPPETETHTQEPPTLFMNGEVPYYPDIAASAYPEEDFTMNESGRIEYTDAAVKYTTGVDVSSHQGNIDWDAVKNDGIDFAVIRIGLRGYGSSGEIYDDDYSEANITGAKEAGLKVGVYFFSQAITPEEAEEEADFVVKKLRKINEEIDYPVFFDWENEPGKNMRTDNMTGYEMTQCAVAFCEKIKDAGYIPGIYFNLSYGYAKYDLNSIKDYHFWYAQHEKESPSFYYNYDIWQYTYKGTVDGIDTQVDMNISFAEYAAKG